MFNCPSGITTSDLPVGSGDDSIVSHDSPSPDSGTDWAVSDDELNPERELILTPEHQIGTTVLRIERLTAGMTLAEIETAAMAGDIQTNPS